MANDGSLEVAWKGQAFPYLMHHPSGFMKTENYGSAKPSKGEYSMQRNEAASDTLNRAGTGTWGGAAPKGYLNGRPPPPEPVNVPVNDSPNLLLATGARMPLLGLGTTQITTPEAIQSALSSGYLLLDCAPANGNEAIVGRGLTAWVAAGGVRGDVFITSKIAKECHRPELLKASCESSIADLSCTYLDLLVLEWPTACVPGAAEGTVDSSVTMEQTWSAMEALVDAGLVKAIGTSNFGLAQAESLLSSCRIKPVSNSVELHPLLAQRKLVGVCYRKGIQCVSLLSLGCSAPENRAELAVVAVVEKVAKQAGKTVEQVLLRWNTQRGIPVVLESGDEGVRQACASGMFKWKLSNEQKALLDTLDVKQRYISPAWHSFPDAEEGGLLKPSLNATLLAMKSN